MALNAVSILELLFVFILVPATGFLILHHAKKGFRPQSRYFDVAALAFAAYIAFTWNMGLQNGDLSTTPILNIPLGESPAVLIVLTAFLTGSLTEIAYDRFNPEEIREKIKNLGI